MLGPVIIVFLIVLALPALLLIGGAVFAALLGWQLTDNAEYTHQGSELIDLNT